MFSESGIFIVGAPRSGTTLLRLMLDAHPLLAIPPETHFIRDLIRKYGNASASIDELITTIAETPRWHDFGLTVRDLQAAFISDGVYDIVSALKSFYGLYARRKNKLRWGDKTPEHGAIICKIASMFPTAKFIHIVRDGRDVLLSLQSTWFGREIGLEKHARWWSNYVDFVGLEGLSCEHFLTIRFEDLIRFPKDTLKMICDFVELEYSDDLLLYHRSAKKRLDELRDYRTPAGQFVSSQQRCSIHRRTSCPPDPSRIGDWRRDMSAQDVREYSTIARATLAKHGYDVL